ncbi:hypothetical protein DRQ25_01595 [Candidatus Fermentibacteria bacterium]|nr:MAG: hypothetical protein DRQ25_01595 [Candidatus Fermentibacteria bacterium]
MIKQLLVKFKGMDVECFCDINAPKCDCKDCKEYVVKFTEVKRTKTTKGPKKPSKVADPDIAKLERQLKRSTSELERSLKNMKNIRIK